MGVWRRFETIVKNSQKINKKKLKDLDVVTLDGALPLLDLPKDTTSLKSPLETYKLVKNFRDHICPDLQRNS